MAVIRVKVALFLVMLGAAPVMAGSRDVPEGKPEAEQTNTQVLEQAAVDRTKDVDAAGMADGAATVAGGNPFWTISLSALTVTRDRPLFSASRRPFVLASPASPAPEAAPPPPAASPPVERPQLSLVGTIVGSRSSVALLKDSGSEALLRLRVGQENSGWQVRGINMHSVTVEKGGDSIVLDLPKPN
jgi:hypothetical protein